MIKKLKEYKGIIADLLKLSLPILGGNLSQILISFADTATAGRYSTLALGAVSVASAILMTVTIGAIGLILSVSPVISNFRGEKIPSKKYFKLTILFALFVSIPFFLIIELISKNIQHFGFEQDLAFYVKQYIEITAWSVFPTAIFVALKEFLQAWEKVIVPNLLMFFMVILNVILNIILTFGFDFGSIHIPSLGVVGLSLATLISKTIAPVFMILYCLPLFKTPCYFSKKYLKDLFKIGTPISLAMFFEFLGFNLTAILIGKFSALFAGVHNIVLCIANLTFMIVLSVSSAASIKIGYFNGKKDKENIIKYSVTNIFSILAICFVMFLVMIFKSDFIIKIFTNDLEVLRLSKKILKIVICFLFFDGFQAGCVGILKGLKDTKIIMKIMLFGYLGIAIPLGTYVAYFHGYVLEGYWTGLALALFFAAVVAGRRVVKDITEMKV